MRARTHTGLLSALRQSGLEHLLHAYLQATADPSSLGSSEPVDSSIAPLASLAPDAIERQQYESAWRLSLWDASAAQAEGLGENETCFDAAIHAAVGAISSRTVDMCTAALNTARRIVMGELSAVTRQSSGHIHSNLARLQVRRLAARD